MIPQFGNAPNTASRLPLVNDAVFSEYVYDTWTPEYEKNGRNEDFDTLVDEGTNGFDNDSANGVDDNLERETMPPYGYPVRGLQISLRVIERNTSQVDQATVIQSFVPE